MAKHVDTSTKNCILYNAQRRFSFCQSVFEDSSLATGPAAREHRNASNYYQPEQTNVSLNLGYPSLNLAHRQSSNWLQCTFTKIGWTTRIRPGILVPKLNSAQLISETTSWLRFVCQLTVSRPVNFLCKVLFQLSLTVLIRYRCCSRIKASLTSSLPRT